MEHLPKSTEIAVFGKLYIILVWQYNNLPIFSITFSKLALEFFEDFALEP